MAIEWFKVAEKLPKENEAVVVKFNITQKNGSELPIIIGAKYQRTHNNDSVLHREFNFYLDSIFNVEKVMHETQIIEWGYPNTGSDDNSTTFPANTKLTIAPNENADVTNFLKLFSSISFGIDIDKKIYITEVTETSSLLMVNFGENIETKAGDQFNAYIQISDVTSGNEVSIMTNDGRPVTFIFNDTTQIGDGGAELLKISSLGVEELFKFIKK